MCRVTVNAHGPLRIEGDFTIVDPEGRPLDLKGRTSLALCRCGASRNKPFCDGTHNTVNFRSIVTGEVTSDR
ncbi:MAG TPA: CDGSH iron-sulfur domain-containing protein [Gemmatimonadales bacterium]|jgi:CDGSH-type Zn-finger protein|nr:CDGSH iron-sulfur domain-containing protein [Gemmatimonadales bacterium]